MSMPKPRLKNDPTTHRLPIQSCHGKKKVGPLPYLDEAEIIGELRTKFIRERVEQERDALTEEVLRHIQRILNGRDEGPVI